MSPQPRVKIERSADVANVNGNPTAMFLKKDKISMLIAMFAMVTCSGLLP